jgi:hypothetical protein
MVDLLTIICQIKEQINDSLQEIMNTSAFIKWGGGSRFSEEI